MNIEPPPRYKGRPTRPPVERAVENRFVQEARKLGCKTRKLNGGGQRDWSDQLVLVPGGATLLIEFKRVGAKLRPTQQAFKDACAAIGHTIHVYDSWQAALAIVRLHCHDR